MMLPLLGLIGLVVSMLYTWLGIAYASTIIVIAGLLGLDVNRLVAPILLSQVFAAAAGTTVRRVSRRGGGGAGLLESMAMGAAALAALAAAMLVGVRLPGPERVYGNALLLAAAAAVNLARPASGRPGGRRGGLGGLLAAGLATGLVKGVLGGGATPVMVAAQRILGEGFDAAVLRTLAAELVICLVASAPYLLAYGANPAAFAVLSASSVAGVLLGSMASARVSQAARRTSSSILMAALAAAAAARLAGL